MRAKDYIRKHEREITHLDEIRRVIEDLYPIRHSKLKTNEYHDRILNADHRYSEYERTKGRQLVAAHSFVYNDGEINKDIAYYVRRELFEVIENDRSFGYMFFLLRPKKINIKYSEPSAREIEMAINFDWDDTKELLSGINSYPEKLKLLLDCKTECSQHCSPNTTTAFIENCKMEIKKINDIINMDSGANVTVSAPSDAISVFLSDKKGMRIDYIRVINVLFELGFFVDSNGNSVSKTNTFKAFGLVVNRDLSTFQNDLSVSLSSSNNDLRSTLRIFNSMIDKQNELNDKKMIP